jgi:hypothetical protein
MMKIEFDAQKVVVQLYSLFLGVTTRVRDNVG